ncbi:Rhodanese domain protein [Paenibacillus curdlanolyticus YK9]|uniref:Rhodanese domain protein n=1 Tax=Paenibacillus curdlanolyticus YK9 TaxID=717606 RepID=E0ICC3_9BACL|nr:rhodanese-like domain-containing protein [Paenibacillus curdlanolyticus]EFM09809.1 Rhodanese domain protein [Paenibacillus curdlanolyticus YK9]
MKRWEDITAGELIALLEDGRVKPEQIIDVREAEEWTYYHLEGTRHVPMSQFQSMLSTLSKEEALYILCAHGVRSVAVCNYMQENGYSAHLNIAGGIAEVAAIQGFQYD